MSIEQLRQILQADAVASGRKGIYPRFLGDEIWKFQITLRVLEYCCSMSGIRRVILLPLRAIFKVRYHNLSLKLGFSIPIQVFDKGLSIPHYGTIVVSRHAKIGENCRIHEGVNIGATNGSRTAPVLGKNVFIGSGAKIIGEVEIADDVCIGANAVVVKSILEPGTTWAGAPAKKISDNGSRDNLNAGLFEEKI